MSIETAPAIEQEIIYPESDGLPMADNTEQFSWIVMIKENLEAWFSDRPDVFVAGDLLWYPVQGKANIRRAPDALVAFGRPKGRRGSYRQWEEDNVAPQVVFEVLSPGNTLAEMAEKLQFYDLYNVEEYYLYDPDSNDLTGWQRREGRLWVIEQMDGWTSPRLGIRFDLSGPTLTIYRPDGQPFLSHTELEQRARQAEQRAERLAARLRAMGIDPDALDEQETGSQD